MFFCTLFGQRDEATRMLLFFKSLTKELNRFLVDLISQVKMLDNVLGPLDQEQVKGHSTPGLVNCESDESVRIRFFKALPAWVA